MIRCGMCGFEDWDEDEICDKCNGCDDCCPGHEENPNEE